MSSLHSTHATGRRLSKEESRAIFVAYQSGDTVGAIAKRWGVSRPTVYRAIEKHARPDAHHGDSQLISIRVSSAEKAALDVLSGRMGLSRSAAARKVLRLASGFLEPDAELVQAVTDLARQVKAIGGNLNQIAAHLNREARLQGRASPNRDQLRTIEASERDLKALAEQIEDTFVVAASRRRAKVEDLLRKTGAT